MRFLITGAHGYVGPRVADWLAARGHQIVLGARGAAPSGLAEWAAAYETRRCDVLDREQVVRAAEGCDVILHLASLDENEASRAPDLAVRTAREGTQHVLDAARASSAGVVYISTYHVYVPAQRIDESSPTGPKHPYGISRLAAEETCGREGAGVPITIFRLSNGYGAPRSADVDRWTLAHNDFVKQARTEHRIVLKTPGTQSRDFVWVEDVAQAVELVAARKAPGVGLFNLGGKNVLRIRDLAERVRRVVEQRLSTSIALECPTATSHEPPVEFAIGRLEELGYAPTDAIDLETSRILDLLGAP